MSDADSAGATRDGAPEQPGDAHEHIGPFRLLQRIGEGGFGVVYLAEQTEPVRRRVALKVIKPGMDTKAVVARFHAERQAIALMDHPGIARALDAGATDAGRPYFAMEFVQGEPITDFCDKHRLTIRQRLELFQRVCGAVQHAHAKGVIHRDLKPSNILVAYRDGKASPKVIDFGVAKALNQRLTDGTVYTHQGQLIGTPEYMSPDQAEMTALDVDTRSDIYSLGVVLYELLTGELPFSSETLRSAGPEEIQRLIREQDPPRPSTRLSTIAHHGKDPDTATRIARARQVQARELPSQLRGDLDWIVMRCLEKDRERRYETANAVALEVGRYLRNEPVNAGPPGAAYRARKFVRRNRFAVTAAGLIGAAVVLGLVGTAVGLVRARDARQVAEAARADAELRSAELESVIELQSEMLSRIEPAAMGAALFERLRDDVRDASADDRAVVEGLDDALELLNATDVALDVLSAEILTPALDAAEERLVDRPLIRAEILTSLGGMLRAYGLLEQADTVLRRALEIRREQLGEDDLTTARSLIALGKLSRQRGRYEEAQALYARALEIRERELGPDNEYTLSAVFLTAALEEKFQRYEEAESLYQRALEGRRALFGEDSEEVLDVLSSLAGLYRDTGRLAEAE
ncbi:MAG: tetratricopeptide repeat protein, partial [Phycisphaerales bacterium]